MRFKFTSLWSVDHLSVEENVTYVDVPVGKKLVGFSRSGKRPDAVELTREELAYLHQNPDYLKHLLPVLK